MCIYSDEVFPRTISSDIIRANVDLLKSKGLVSDPDAFQSTTGIGYEITDKGRLLCYSLFDTYQDVSQMSQ